MTHDSPDSVLIYAKVTDLVRISAELAKDQDGTVHRFLSMRSFNGFDGTWRQLSGDLSAQDALKLARVLLPHLDEMLDLASEWRQSKNNATSSLIEIRILSKAGVLLDIVDAP